jgi:acetylornithine deacetylase/succinyl-diaminopimelate desuccinylase-like protein
MTQLEPIFRHIESHREPFLERLFDYVKQPSISAQGLGIAETAEFLANLLDRIGLEGEIIPTDGHPMVLGARAEDSALPTVLLYGHYDVQPPDPLEAWISPPFDPTIRDGRIYARGIGDNKGQHFANFLAIESLLAVEGRLPCNVLFLLEGEEEVGSPHIADFIRERKDRLAAADLAITSDGGVHESGRPCIMFGVRGVAIFELRARGAARDVHSGNLGGIVPNPLWRLVHLLATMKSDAGEITIDGFYDDVEPPTPMERAALDALPFDVERIKRELGLAELDAPADRPIADRLAVWPTLTINGLHGGYGGEGPKTVLPCKAVAKCDIRLVHNQSRDDIFDKVEAHVRKHAPDIEFVPLGGMEPSKTPLESPFTEPIRRAIVDAQGEEPLLVPALGGTLPDYVFTRILRIPSFVVPYANHDEANHAPNENLEVERFFAGIRTGAAMLVRIGEMPKA